MQVINIAFVGFTLVEGHRYQHFLMPEATLFSNQDRSHRDRPCESYLKPTNSSGLFLFQASQAMERSQRPIMAE